MRLSQDAGRRGLQGGPGRAGLRSRGESGSRQGGIPPHGRLCRSIRTGCTAYTRTSTTSTPSMRCGACQGCLAKPAFAQVSGFVPWWGEAWS